MEKKGNHGNWARCAQFSPLGIPTRARQPNFRLPARADMRGPLVRSGFSALFTNAD
jgi:hypothetical protein